MPGYVVPWYSHILKVQITDELVSVTSDLAPADPMLADICAGVSSTVFENGSSLPQQVRIVNPDGRELLARHNFAERCVVTP